MLSLKGLLTIRRLSLVDTAIAFLLCLTVSIPLSHIISMAGVLEDWYQGRRFGPHYVPIDRDTKGQDNLSLVPGHYSLKLSEPATIFISSFWQISVGLLALASCWWVDSAYAAYGSEATPAILTAYPSSCILVWQCGSKNLLSSVAYLLLAHLSAFHTSTKVFFKRMAGITATTATTVLLFAIIVIISWVLKICLVLKLYHGFTPSFLSWEETTISCQL